MSFEINPVLAGTFDAPGYAPANNVAQTTSTDDVSGPDSRRYTKFDHSDTDAGSTTNFSFSDLVDMLNPLEHIPVVSSVYRAATGEQINPVARVAGDILYGGILGAASAVFSGVSAVADAGLESQTGKDSGGLAVAALFGPDDDKNDPVQLADAGTPAPASNNAAATPDPATPTTKTIDVAETVTTKPFLAALAVPAGAPEAASTPTISSAEISPPAALAANTELPAAAPASLAAASAPSTSPTVTSGSNPAATPGFSQNASSTPGVSVVPAVAPGANSTSSGLGAIPLAKSSSPNKQAYGGVMGPPASPETQNLALAAAQGSSSMRMGHTIYTSKQASGARSLPPMLSSGGGSGLKLLQPVVAPAPVLPTSFTPPSGPSASATFSGAGPFASTSATGATPAAGSPVSAALLQNMMMKAISQYGGSTAAALPGSKLNLVN